MTTHNVYAGEASHASHHFKPTGKLVCYHSPKPRSKDDSNAAEDATRLSSGGYSARFFVGLNVGQKKRYDINDVIDIVWQTRKKQKRSGDASILGQRGIYEDRSGKRVVEQSVQVIIIDFAGLPKKTFVAEMMQLGETLRKKMKQEAVILEIQKSGVVKDVYTIT